MQIAREAFYSPDAIVQQVTEKLEQTSARGESVDYLTFVPDGEPTLDRQLGQAIQRLQPLGVPIAVISNSSLIWQEEVQEALCLADWVSVKIDAISQAVWRKIDRPYGKLNYEAIIEGLTDFARAFDGELVTETMLVQDVNDSAEEGKRLAAFISILHPAKSYLSIPTRPPAESWVHSANEEALHRNYQQYCEQGIAAEYLIGYEGNEFAASGNVEEDLLSITAVHPMREDAVQALLDKVDADWQAVEQLLETHALRRVEYRDHAFYMRTLKT